MGGDGTGIVLEVGVDGFGKHRTGGGGRLAEGSRQDGLAAILVPLSIPHPIRPAPHSRLIHILSKCDHPQCAHPIDGSLMSFCFLPGPTTLAPRSELCIGPGSGSRGAASEAAC